MQELSARPVVRRAISDSSVSSYGEEELSSLSSPPSSPVSEGFLSNPIDVISAAATTLEFHVQSRNMEVLEHQCMVVQQEFDDMLAEKEETIWKETERREIAEKKAKDAEQELTKLRKEVMDLKVKMFQLGAENKAATAILAQQDSSGPKAVDQVEMTLSVTKVTEERILLKKSRKRKPGVQRAMDFPPAAQLNKKKRLFMKRKSF
mmetsp:Transcript_18664/g.37733  ORF Transcript_18664/g.37733 Transcript_18664/m.37733 type:complete len:206 (-) Transcript_18664:499-1116(-)